jgi:flavodoxin
MPLITQDIAPKDVGKHILIVYYSQGNSAKRVAEDLATLLKADTERIIELKARTGFFGFLGAGADSSMKKSTAIAPPAKDPSVFDMVIICTPIWAGHMAPPIRTRLTLMKGKMRNGIFITVSGATKPDRIVKEMATASGAIPIGYLGFVQKDFDKANRGVYLNKMKEVIGYMK